MIKWLSDYCFFRKSDDIEKCTYFTCELLFHAVILMKTKA